MLKLYDLTTEYKREPLGLDEAQPRFGWKLDSDQQDTVQASYRLQIVQGGDVVWDSGRVESAQSILNEYLGPNLAPQTEMLTLGSGSYHYEYATKTSLEIARYTMETPLRVIMEHPVAQAIFRQYAPEFLSNPMLEYVKNEPVTALLAYGDSIKPLFEQVLAVMNQADKR